MLTLVVPSRGRPENMARLVEKCKYEDVDLLGVFNTADDRLDEYKALSCAWIPFSGPDGVVAPLNEGVMKAPYHEFIGFMGDDHLPSSSGWVEQLCSRLESVGSTKGLAIVYGDDGLMGRDLPTAVFMHRKIVDELGWMAPPVLRHLFCDNFWKDLGTDLGILSYVSSAKITHLHPHADVGVSWDSTYELANTPNLTRDRDFYELYRKYDYPGDLARVSKLLK